MCPRFAFHCAAETRRPLASFTKSGISASFAIAWLSQGETKGWPWIAFKRPICEFSDIFDRCRMKGRSGTGLRVPRDARQAICIARAVATGGHLIDLRAGCDLAL